MEDDKNNHHSVSNSSSNHSVSNNNNNHHKNVGKLMMKATTTTTAAAAVSGGSPSSRPEPIYRALTPGGGNNNNNHGSTLMMQHMMQHHNSSSVSIKNNNAYRGIQTTTTMGLKPQIQQESRFETSLKQPMSTGGLLPVQASKVVSSSPGLGGVGETKLNEKCVPRSLPVPFSMYPKCSLHFFIDKEVDFDSTLRTINQSLNGELKPEKGCINIVSGFTKIKICAFDAGDKILVEVNRVLGCPFVAKTVFLKAKAAACFTVDRSEIDEAEKRAIAWKEKGVNA